METVSPVSQSTLSKRPRQAPAVYSLVEVAGLLGISYTKANEMAKAGTLPVTPFKVGRTWRFAKADIDRLLGLDGASGDRPEPDAA
jgi:excisionase family DNA binding protein